MNTDYRCCLSNGVAVSMPFVGTRLRQTCSSIKHHNVFLPPTLTLPLKEGGGKFTLLFSAGLVQPNIRLLKTATINLHVLAGVSANIPAVARCFKRICRIYHHII
jgi:hypothetical protein